MDGSNPYSLDNFNNFNEFNDFYISNSFFNNCSSTISNNSITLTVESKAISIDYIIFPTNK